MLLVEKRKKKEADDATRVVYAGKKREKPSLWLRRRIKSMPLHLLRTRRRTPKYQRFRPKEQ